MPINEKGEFVRRGHRPLAATSYSSGNISTLSVSPSRGLSIASLVLGLMSLFCTGILTAPIAIGLGISALKKISREPARYAGNGLAWSGVATGTVALLISAVWIIPLLSNLIKNQRQTSQVPVATHSSPQVTTSTSEKPEANTPLRWLRQSASTYGSVSNQFEVRILSGVVSNHRIDIQVRETSIDYDGSWADWFDVLRQSDVFDDMGHRYQCDWVHSSGSVNGRVRAGDYREGTLIFYGPIRQDISQLTLNFAYYPGYSSISVQSAVVSDPSQTGERPSNANKRPLESDITVTTGSAFESNEFEIRMVRGFVYPDRVALRIRETSINCDCDWFPWREVVSASYITDEYGNRYSSDLSHSVGWTDGRVSPRGYREGTIVFFGNIRPNTSRITLTFAWIPSRPISMDVAVR
jgi:hypothetical protein